METSEMRGFAANRYLFWQLLLASSSSFLPLFIMKYGFEIVDSGWASVLIRDFYSNPEMAGRASPWFLTWAMGALLTSGDDFNMSVLRVAAFVPIFLSAIFTYLVFYVYGYRSTIVAVSIAVAGIICYSGYAEYFINYNTISVCFIVISLSMLFFSGRVSINLMQLNLLCFLGGVFYTLSSLSRISSVALIIPCIFVIFSLHGLRIRPYVSFLLGGLCCALILGFVFFRTGHLKYVTDDMTQFIYSAFVSNDNASHSKSQLIAALWSSGVLSIGWALLFLVSSLSLFEGLRLGNFFKSVAGLGAVIFSFSVAEEYFSIFPSFLALLFFAYAFKAEYYRQFIFPITGLLLAFIFPLGATNGFKNSCFALWFLIPGILVYLQGRANYSIAIAAASIMAILGVYDAFMSPYWDQSVFSLKCTIRNGNIGALHTSCDRQRVLDEVVEAVHKYSSPGEEIFVYQNSPMIYILTGQRPWIPYPWPYLIPVQRIENSFLDRAKNSLPKVVVREKLSPFNEDWPNTEILPLETHRGGHNYSKFYQTFFRQRGYISVYENEMFEVLAMERPEAETAGPAS